MKKRNPVAKAVRTIRPGVVEDKREKMSEKTGWDELVEALAEMAEDLENDLGEA